MKWKESAQYKNLSCVRNLVRDMLVIHYSVVHLIDGENATEI